MSGEAIMQWVLQGAAVLAALVVGGPELWKRWRGLTGGVVVNANASPPAAARETASDQVTSQQGAAAEVPGVDRREVFALLDRLDVLHKQINVPAAKRRMLFLEGFDRFLNAEDPA